MSKEHVLTFAEVSAQAWHITPEVQNALLAELANTGRITLAYDDTEIHYTDWNYSYYVPASKKGSTAVMTISGVIYDYYAQFVCAKLRAIYADKNVKNLVIKMNSPGGAADAGYRIANCLLEAPFDTWCHVEYGQASSAGYMIMCSCDAASASRANDRIGSIGTYIQYVDWSKAYEKSGVVVKDIYARQSSEKNLEGRAAKEGNFKPLEDYVSQEADAFIAYVKDRRESLNTDTMDPFKGKVFSATDALTIGLIDFIGSDKDVFANINSTDFSTNSKPRLPMKAILGFVSLAALVSIKGVAAGEVTEDQTNAINTELKAAGYDNVAVISATQLEEFINSAAAAPEPQALTALQTQVTALTTERDRYNTQLTTANNKITELQGKVDAYGSQPGEVASKGVKSDASAKLETESEGSDEAKAAMAEIAELPHNKALAGTFLAEKR